MKRSILKTIIGNTISVCIAFSIICTVSSFAQQFFEEHFLRSVPPFDPIPVAGDQDMGTVNSTNAQYHIPEVSKLFVSGGRG